MTGKIGLFSYVIYVALIMGFYPISMYGEEKSVPRNYVIKINEQEIYFDLGYNHGVQKGMVYQVLRRSDNAETVQIAKIFVTETFDWVSKAVLKENVADSVIEVGDWVEIILEPVVGTVQSIEKAQKGKHEEIKSKPSIIPAAHEVEEEIKTKSSWTKWATLTAGIATGLASVSRYRLVNSTNNEIQQTKQNQYDVKKIRQLISKGKKAQTRYYIFTGISTVLLSYTSYKFLLGSRTAPTTFNISRSHMGFRFHRSF